MPPLSPAEQSVYDVVVAIDRGDRAARRKLREVRKNLPGGGHMALDASLREFVSANNRGPNNMEEHAGQITGILRTLAAPPPTPEQTPAGQAIERVSDALIGAGVAAAETAIVAAVPAAAPVVAALGDAVEQGLDKLVDGEKVAHAFRAFLRLFHSHKGVFDKALATQLVNTVAEKGGDAAVRLIANAGTLHIRNAKKAAKKAAAAKAGAK